jgi:hypothetical protein
MSFTPCGGRHDVFISYRVSTDYELAEKLYTELTKRGVKVWWDKTSLEVAIQN